MIQQDPNRECPSRIMRQSGTHGPMHGYPPTTVHDRMQAGVCPGWAEWGLTNVHAHVKRIGITASTAVIPTRVHLDKFIGQ